MKKRREDAHWLLTHEIEVESLLHGQSAKSVRMGEVSEWEWRCQFQFKFFEQSKHKQTPLAPITHTIPFCHCPNRKWKSSSTSFLLLLLVLALSLLILLLVLGILSISIFQYSHLYLQYFFWSSSLTFFICFKMEFSTLDEQILWEIQSKRKKKSGIENLFIYLLSPSVFFVWKILQI